MFTTLAYAVAMSIAGANAKPIETAPDGVTPPKANAQMQAVLDQLATLGGKPIETLTAVEARKQPTPTDAVKSLLTKQGRSLTPEAVGKVENRMIKGPGGDIAIRIYWPKQGGQNLPVVHYIHGGGWVIADLDVYDSSPRALANAAGAIVVSSHYRQAPEHPFPAAHDDTLAAYRWVTENAESLGGDPKRIAIAGESAGGNMAAAIAMNATQQGLPAPVHQLLIYPVADQGFDTPSYKRNDDAKPLNKEMMQWFFAHYLPTDKAPSKDPRIALLDVKPRADLPSATVITAEIDPLRSEGERYAKALEQAGVAVDHRDFKGVTHEFFGMGAVVDDAKDAVAFAASGLDAAFGGTRTAQVEQPN